MFVRLRHRTAHAASSTLVPHLGAADVTPPSSDMPSLLSRLSTSLMRADEAAAARGGASSPSSVSEPDAASAVSASFSGAAAAGAAGRPVRRAWAFAASTTHSSAAPGAAGREQRAAEWRARQTYRGRSAAAQIAAPAAAWRLRTTAAAPAAGRTSLRWRREAQRCLLRATLQLRSPQRRRWSAARAAAALTACRARPPRGPATKSPAQRRLRSS